MAHSTGSRSTLILGLFCLATLTLPGCTVIPRQSGLATNYDNVAASNDEIRTQLYGNTLGFGSGIRNITNFIIDGTDNPQMRQRALRLKIDAIATSQVIVAYHDPLISILDLWAFSVQLVNYYTTGNGRNDFGVYQDTLVAVLGTFPAKLEQRARLLVKDPAMGDGKVIVNSWADAHPITGPLTQRPWMTDTLTTLTSASNVGAAGAMGVMAERISNLSDRLAIYYAYLPNQMRWEGEVFLEELMERNKDLRAAIDSVASMSGSIGRIVDIAESGSPLVDSLRAAVLADARLLLLEAIDSVEVIRLATIDDVDQQIAAVLAAVQAERIAVLATVDTLSQARINQSVAELKGLLRLGVFLGIVMLITPFIVGLVVGRVLSKNRAPAPA